MCIYPFLKKSVFINVADPLQSEGGLKLNLAQAGQ